MHSGSRHVPRLRSVSTAVAIVLAVASSACAGVEPSGTSAPVRTNGTTTTAQVAEATVDERDEPDAVSVCTDLVAEQVGTVGSEAVTEASGVVVSQTYDDVVWVHNDSGSAPAVIAVGLDGAELGVFELPGVDGTDIEDVALVDGTFFLADIGDNDRVRDDVAVYRFAEPDPFGIEPIQSVDIVRFRYPQQPFDAESLLVDPLTGQLIIIAKSFRIGGSESTPLSAAAAPIFVADAPLEAGTTIELVQQGAVALDELAAFATGQVPAGLIGDLGLGDVATGADVRPDGSAVAVRTYRSVWLFRRRSGDSVADALQGVPCEAPTMFEQQGESVGFVDGTTDGFVTIGEGIGPAVNITSAG